VSSAKDDSSAFVIAQNLRSDLSGMKSVTSSLNRAKSVLDVTLNGATQISDLMNQMQAKALEASDTGLDVPSRNALNLDFKALQSQINTVINSSDFNGSNLLDGNAVSPAVADSLSALQSIKGSSTLVVANMDIQTMLGTSLTTADITTAVNASAQLIALETAKGLMAGKLNTLGSAARQVDSQLTFTAKLGDAIKSGIGTLVDADLAAESANLQALQLKQQLGVQALSIANQSPQAISSLFR
jgi:flagellin